MNILSSMLRSVYLKPIHLLQCASIALANRKSTKVLLSALLCVLFVNPMSSLGAEGLGAEEVKDTNASTENVETQLPLDEPLSQWIQATESDNADDAEKTEIQKVLEQNIRTVKLENVVPPIRFKSGEADIPENYVALLREVLTGMQSRVNVRVHFIGHTDNAPLSGGLKQKYGDNLELSRERAGNTAEFFQRALNLPPEGISFDGVGDTQPVASNNTSTGKAQNRRVEVQVWYDEIDEELVEKTVLIQQELGRVKICRIETVCRLRYKEGHSRRARLKNLVSPLRYEEGMAEIPPRFIAQLREARNNLRDKANVQIKLIGHTDNTPLEGRLARIYGEHVPLSKAHARRVALAVQDVMGLPNRAIDSDGKGSAFPIASNDLATGRAANRRIEVEFWHDDPLQELSDELQLCPESSGAETVSREYTPPAGNVNPVYFEDGQPVLPPGYVERLKRIMDELSDKGNVRVRMLGYTNNERLDRRTAQVYGDDIGLSTARARRVMEALKAAGGFSDEQLEFEGRGFVQSDDVVNAGFLEFDESRVEARVFYDDLAMLDDQDGLEIERVTREVELQNPYALNLMRITVDGIPIDDPGKNTADVQRCTDVALDAVDVQFKFDNLALKPRLNITAWPNVVRYRDKLTTSFPENLLTFKAYTNYPKLIARSEVRLFEKDQSTRDTPFAVIALNESRGIGGGTSGEAEWSAKFENYVAPAVELQYVLRVYDKNNRFDETRPQTLWLLDEIKRESERENEGPDQAAELLAGFGENRLALQNIDKNGGSVRVTGKNVPDDHSVWFAGVPVPVNEAGEFVSEDILPSGLHTVEVAILDESGNGELYLRDLELKKNDWFYVGIADITASLDSTNGPAALVTGDTTHYDNDTAIDGRLAFYSKGKFGNNWELTASADTLEGPIEDILTNFMDKSPDAVFRRLDPDYYYPTFGDDSSVEEMAPTLGKFYAKLKKDQNFGLWGNFNIGYTDNNLAHVDRSLYGANLHYENAKTTDFGEKTFSVDVFAAEPGTISGRDEFRGTGGSLYFLKHQDILGGSDRFRIEVREKISGLVLAVKNLTPVLDYDIDYIQGRVLLGEPLSASSNDGLIVDSDNGGDNEVYLVARYEYSPGFDDSGSLSTGGRAHYWFGDSVKLGVTSSAFGDGTLDNSLNAADFTYRKTAGTWLKFEQAGSTGLSGESFVSNDGGYNYNQVEQLLTPDLEAKANRVDASLRFEDVFAGIKGKATLYSQHLDAGYSAPQLSALTDTVQSGGTLAYPVLDNLNLKLKLDKKTQEQGLHASALELDADYGVTDNWNVALGVRQDSREDLSPVVPLTQTEGDRTDVALRASYDSKAKWSTYGFVQDSVKITGSRESNARAGIGGAYRATERLKLNAEVSSGDLGAAASLGTDYLLSDRTNLYTNYALENERSDNGVRARKGNLSSGFKTQYSDSASVYVEERYTHGDVPTGLLHSTGIDLAPSDRLNLGLSADIGTLEDNRTGAITDRDAYGVRIGYSFDALTYSGAVEMRVDTTENPVTDTQSTSTERTTTLYKNNLKYQLNPNWRLIGKLNHSTSESSLGEFYNGDFTEAVIGSGYRPIDNDKLNALFKYTYFSNLPSTDQVSLSNTAAEYVQKSNIISADMIYDLSDKWSLGAKYAHRFGEISLDRTNPVFFESQADLYVLRADWRFLPRWEALLEARTLRLPEAGDTRSGALLAVYRDIGNNMKFGLGYNFTDFSDDLTDLDFDSQGVFLNFVATR